MNGYLAGIAARNSISEHSAFMPVMRSPRTERRDDVAVDFSEEWPDPFLPDDRGDIESSERIRVPESRSMEPDEMPRQMQKEQKEAEREPGDSEGIVIEPDMPMQVQRQIMIPEPEPGPEVQREKQKEPYIARHVERIREEARVVEQASFDLEKAQSSTETSSDTHEVRPVSDDPVRQTGVSRVSRETEEKTVSRVPAIDGDEGAASQRLPAVPVPEPDAFSARAGLASSTEQHGARQIMPRSCQLFSQGERRSAGESRKQEEPKLMIGKITVEIVPPKASQPQKVVTRVIQKPAEESDRRVNRLGIGLGQM